MKWSDSASQKWMRSGRRFVPLLLAFVGPHVSAQSSSTGTGGPSLSAAQMREDIAVFRRDFMAQDRSYTPAARADAEARLNRLEANIDGTSPALFELTLARIVALADNGHTASFAAPRSRRYNRVTIRLTPLGDDFRVLRSVEANSDLLGARLRSIDARPIAELRDVARTLVGGLPRWRDRSANFLFESPEQLHALGLASDATRATYVFELPSGRSITRVLDGAPPNPDVPRSGSDRWLYPELQKSEGSTWRTLLSPSRAPLALQAPDSVFRSWLESDMQALVIQFRQNFDAPGRPIRDFTGEVTATIATAHPRNVVLDMRLNGGGDLNTTRDFMKSLPGLVPGRVFVLTSPWTFSAAISSVGYVKQTAPTRVTIVGEDVGDRLNFFSEGRVVQLPNSGAQILYATQRHDYQTGCRGFSDCHGPVVRNPIAVPTLAPEVSAPWTIEAYQQGKDPAIEAVANAIRRGS